MHPPASPVAVIGAGIIGVSCAAHLARRGIPVLLIDRRGPGEMTSYGNAGGVQNLATSREFDRAGNPQAHRRSNAVFAFGHGFFGLIGAATTGDIVADLIAGLAPSIDLNPYRIDRF